MDPDNYERDALEDPSDPDINFGGPGYDYGSEEDDEPGPIDALTFSEMDTVINRVSDGRERADTMDASVCFSVHLVRFIWDTDTS
jgi:hypothetical protein